MNTQDNTGVYFTKIEFENFRCLGDEAVLDLSDETNGWKRWTVILGDNATGKTSILQAIAGLEQTELSDRVTDIAHRVKSSFISKLLISKKYKHLFRTNDKDKGGRVRGYLKFNDTYDTNMPDINFGFDINGVNSGRGKHDKIYENVKIFGYGASRVMSSTSLSEDKSENSETLFSEEAKLINAEEWLLQLDYAASKDSEVKDYAKAKRDLVQKVLIDLLPDVTVIRFTNPTKENLKPSVEFLTSYGWVTIHQLSLGYKTMVVWMVDLAYRLFERYPQSSNPLAEPAIVLIDEIDLHLHPKWQRQIFTYLSEKFTRTQFIATAHSPLIVQSAPEDVNLVVLRKEGDHVIIDQNVENVRQWRIDQILTSEIFDIQSARSPEVEQMLEERKNLLQKSGLFPEEQQRLNYLNEKVHSLPTADDPTDIEAMEIIRKAAEYLKSQKK